MLVTSMAYCAQYTMATGVQNVFKLCQQTPLMFPYFQCTTCALLLGFGGWPRTNKHLSLGLLTLLSYGLLPNT